jgi:hypothetical protein
VEPRRDAFVKHRGVYGEVVLWIIRAALFIFNTAPSLPAGQPNGGLVIHFLNFSYLKYMRFIMPPTGHDMSKPQLLKLATRRVKMWKAAWRHPKVQSLPYGNSTCRLFLGVIWSADLYWWMI